MHPRFNSKNHSARCGMCVAALALAGIAGGIGYQFGSDPTEPTPKPQATGRPPLIGISSLNEATYVKAIMASGGIPIILPDAGGGVPVEHYLELLDGLLLPGGDDIPASEFDEEPHETLTLIPDDRLKFERALSRAWIERIDKPLLGICLGCQWLSVASDGSLVQNIPSEFGITHRVESHGARTVLSKRSNPPTPSASSSECSGIPKPSCLKTRGRRSY